MKLRKRDLGKIELNMTAMIDIVFQLLVFFILTFKVSEQEGDFSIKMPLGGVGATSIDALVPPMKVRLQADPGTGQLVSCSLNEERLAMGTTASSRFLPLHEKILSVVGSDLGPGSLRNEAEVEIDADYNLNYQFVIEAITAVSGYKDPRTGDIIKLVQKIKFAPPRPAAGG